MDSCRKKVLEYYSGCLKSNNYAFDIFRVLRIQNSHGMLYSKMTPLLNPGCHLEAAQTAVII
jgi:hypothetical protein